MYENFYLFSMMIKIITQIENACHYGYKMVYQCYLLVIQMKKLWKSFNVWAILVSCSLNCLFSTAFFLTYLLLWESILFWFIKNLNENIIYALSFTFVNYVRTNYIKYIYNVKYSRMENYLLQNKIFRARHHDSYFGGVVSL